MNPIRIASTRRSDVQEDERRSSASVGLMARGIEICPFEDGPWRPEFGKILLIRGNLAWFPALRRQLYGTPLDQLPRVIIWHAEPLPPPRASGQAWPWLDHREIVKVLTRDRRATDPYTNYFILRRLHKMGLPHRLFVSTAERVEFLAERGIPSEHLPLGYFPEQGRDLGLERDIDVLFLGANTLRRQLKIAYLRRQGVKVTSLGDWQDEACWGESRTRLINRAKVFLNIPRFAGQFALLRFTLGACNGALLLSEPLYSSAPFEAGVHYVSAEYREMPELIRYYLAHGEERSRIAEAGYRLAVERCRLEDSVDRLAECIRELSEGRIGRQVR